MTFQLFFVFKMPKVDCILEDLLCSSLEDNLLSRYFLYSSSPILCLSLHKTLWCLWAQCLDSVCFNYLSPPSRLHFQLILRCHFPGIAYRYFVTFQLFHYSLPDQTIEQLLCHLFYVCRGASSYRNLYSFLSKPHSVHYM